MRRRRSAIRARQGRRITKVNKELSVKAALSLKPSNLDIVERLQNYNDGDYDGTAIMEIAAEEIINLRKALAAAKENA